MLDIGWSEIAVIVVVALIVIGPKDLPLVLKTVGTWIRKARMMTREFQGHIDEMIREAELDDVRKKALELRDMNVAKQIENTIDPTGSLRTAFDVDPSKPETHSQPAPAAPPPPVSGPAPAAAEPAAQPTPAPVAEAVSSPTRGPGEPAETEKRA